MRRQSTLTLAVATLVLAACADTTSPSVRDESAAPPSAAVTKFNEWFNVAGTIYDPCTMEMVALEGRFHQVVRYEETADGVQATYHLNSDALQGFGLTSGDRYLYQTVQKQSSEVTFDPFSSSYEFSARYHVISQGSKDNWFTTIAYRYTYPPGTFEIISNESECRG